MRSLFLFKLYDIFSNSTDKNNSNHAKFLRFLRSLKVDGILINDDHKQLHHFSANTPVTYGLPKVRKPAIIFSCFLNLLPFFACRTFKRLFDG